MPEPVWRCGALALPFSSLTLFTAVIICLAITYVEGRRKHLPESQIIDFLLLALVGGTVGGRLVHAALFDPSYYFGQPFRLFYILDYGFSFWGGLICVIVVISIWGYRRNLIVERYLDAAAPALAFALAWGSMGARFRGKEMAAFLPWAIVDQGVRYHPEGVYAVILLMMLYFILKSRRSRVTYEGELFFWFLLGFSTASILLDFTRDLPRLWSVFTPGQIASGIVFVFALYFTLAGPRISLASPYMSRAGYRCRTKPQKAVHFVRHLALMTGMALLYYWIHQPSLSLPF